MVSELSEKAWVLDPRGEEKGKRRVKNGDVCVDKRQGVEWT